MKLSTRLQMIADMVCDCNVIADVGTDHGWLPISLVKGGIVDHAIAMDVAEGPLERAREHISEFGLDGKIECRLSDGLNGLEKDEADAAVIAGMGGDLLSKIINDNPDKVDQLIVSPHTHPELVRKTLLKNSYVITDERSCIDAGKYYFAIKAVKSYDLSEELDEEELYFGPVLLRNKDKVLFEYLNLLKDRFKSIPQQASFSDVIEQGLKHYN